ncbi:hypothetical protein KBP30_40685 [Streptomyces sp. Go40/10]|uniref:hypothetical protein n=1 Tax=Streptomyces sp. Go40/10 TaxID=2825844 RepID=UPI001E63F04A|nr:hypothetical protein [Streptomyces sp. Go40/10]UFR07074.1 hypothetical protein KBP30_40685 [Streptomyces sp. Go40/10]
MVAYAAKLPQHLLTAAVAAEDGQLGNRDELEAGRFGGEGNPAAVLGSAILTVASIPPNASTAA